MAAGNHDHYDGLDAFTNFINERAWYTPDKLRSLSQKPSWVMTFPFTDHNGVKPPLTAQIVVFGLDGGIHGEISGAH